MNSLSIIIGSLVGILFFSIGVIVVYKKIAKQLSLNLEIQQAEKSLIDEVSNLGLADLEKTEAGKQLLALHEKNNVTIQKLAVEARRREEEEEKIHKVRLERLDRLSILDAKRQEAETQNTITRMNLETKELEHRRVAILEMAKLNHEKTIKTLEVTEQALQAYLTLVEKLPAEQITDQWSDSIKTLNSLIENIRGSSQVDNATEKTFKAKKEIESIKSIDGVENINVAEKDNNIQASMRLSIESSAKPYELSFTVNQNYPSEAPTEIKLINSDGLEIDFPPIIWTPSMNIANIVLIAISLLLHGNTENKTLKLEEAKKRPLAG